MANMTFYQTAILIALAIGFIPVMLIWARFDGLPHRRELLIAVMLCPLMLTENALRAFELGPGWHFLVMLFYPLPALITSLLCLAITRLVLDMKKIAVNMLLVPGAVAVLASIPFWWFSADYKSALLEQGAIGEVTQHGVLYGYMLLCQLAMLWQAFNVESRIREYTMGLSDQVVDTHLYRFSAGFKAFASLVTLAFCGAVITLLVALDLLPLQHWLIVLQGCYYLLFVVLTLVLMEKRRYAPSPLDYNKLHAPDYDESTLREALTRAEQAMLKHKAYKRIGLRLKDFARLADVDPTVLAVASRSLLKRNFRAFVYHYRLEYAKRILMRSNVRVSDVAKRLGFDSERFLSDLFVKYVHKMAKDGHKQEQDRL
ncbi:helix-turn-helix domain-containing protein [Lacimicrobium sp. SS2-24]|uniref:helix-turn-helix transcriptional regulator n=1 Tax=Lacimicrobium sp. SS2-24 TaxID=2005569 RepID=UPI000B4A5863|nr:helix-turn-helix domain-containing protein [Lacimicrobium sp. SS2-24]